MTKPPLIVYRWDAATKSMVVSRRFENLACAHFKDGNQYALIERQSRSEESHGHYFAVVADVYKNLPEAIAKQYKSAEHLRKRALIHVGYCDERKSIMDTQEDAVRAARFLELLDEFSMVQVSGKVITIWRPHSQSEDAMDRQVFQDSKQKVIEWLADLIGVSPEELSTHGGRSA